MKTRLSVALFALWRYDTYPYVLGGTITDILANGNVETKEYGYGFYFKPLLILPVKEGKELLNRLEALEDEYSKALEKFHKEWIVKAMAITPIVKG